MKKLFLTTALLGLTILASGVAHAAPPIYGTSSDDTMQGTDSAEEIWGYKGDDRMQGFSGHDKMYGGGGADYMYGGAGRDAMWGQNGKDTLDSGAPQQENHTEVQGGGGGKDTCYSADYGTGTITYSSCYYILDGYIPW